MEYSIEEGKEHTLVCLSASPTNAKIIKTAAKMANAFGGGFSALYVRTSYADKMDDEERERIEYHIQLAEQLGANVITVYGEDISYQIAEFSRVSGVTRVVVGRSNVKRRYFWGKLTLAEQLTKISPNLDIHIIPDGTTEVRYKTGYRDLHQYIFPSIKDIFITLLILVIVTAIGTLFYRLGFTESNIITIFLLGALLTPLFTKNYACSFVCSLGSVLLFNFFFTEPRLTFHAYESGYPVTFAVMLIASIITGSLANRLKNHAKQSALAAFKTRVLFDTNQLLQKAKDTNEVLNVAASQLMKLLNRNVVIYPEKNNILSKGYLFSISRNLPKEQLFNCEEESVVNWVYQNKCRAGATTNIQNKVKCLYLPICINDKVYGVIGIHINGKGLDSLENSVLLSIVGECALSIENIHNLEEKELAAVHAKNEQLRANLLRAISHDLRTPLTSISGNASNLLANYDKLDDETRKRIFSDIFDDSQWLISLVENLLSITRLEEGRMNFNISLQLMDEVMEEVVYHIKRKNSGHKISVECADDMMFARMDAKLIIQVILNLIDNAVKYTHKDSEIKLLAKKTDGYVLVSVTDNGPGIPEQMKSHVFEMFYTGDNKIADSRRSLGLGLYLCKTIVNEHGGEITLTDNLPQGCIFSFTIPSSEVNINE